MADRDEHGRFKKGCTGNPTGRAPRDREERYYEITLSTVSFDAWARIVAKARDQALKGEPVARKWLSDYLVGTPPQRHELTGEDGGPLSITIIERPREQTD